MKSRAFTTFIGTCHEEWLSKIFDVPRTDSSGKIDLANDILGIESKARYVKWCHRYAVAAYQFPLFRRQNPTQDLYWAFILYNLVKEPRKIKKSEDLEPLVSKREAWFFDWDWIKQFPISRKRKTGRYRYPPIKVIREQQEGFREITIDKNTLYVPRDTPLEKRLVTNSQ